MRLSRVFFTFFIILIFLILTAPSLADQEETGVLFERTHLLKPVNGAIEKGHVFKTASGNMYISLIYLYLEEYHYNPKVTVYKGPEFYQLMIQYIEKAIPVKKIENDTAQTDTSSWNEMPDTIESYIVSAFTGLTQGNRYELENGQVWEQTDAPSQSWIAAMPPVKIWRSDKKFMMRVEPSEQIITVRRIR